MNELLETSRHAEVEVPWDIQEARSVAGRKKKEKEKKRKLLPACNGNSTNRPLDIWIHTEVQIKSICHWHGALYGSEELNLVGFKYRSYQHA
jgi:hypothetical protein